MITLEIKAKYKKNIPANLLDDYARQILKQLNNDQETDLSILLDSDSALRKLNKLYLGFDQPTDVLSFESNEINPETGRVALGDIAISYPTAEKQAFEAGHPVENEIILLLTHGILHLSGFDHNTKTEKQEMWQKQQAILDTLGITINRISGDEEFHD
jgi:probable rRNA maturation factor